MKEEKREMMILVSGNSILKQIPGLSRIAGVGKRTAQATPEEKGCVGPGARAKESEHKGRNKRRAERSGPGQG